MKENENYNFDFNFDDKIEDIFSSSKKEEKVYEDIVSDSSYRSSKAATNKSKKSYNKNGRWQKITAWWNNVTKGKKAALISLTSVILVVVMLLGWFFVYFDYNYRYITGDPDKLGFEGVKDKNVINVALFGVDSRDKDVFKGNTDSIMILSLNTNTKKIKIFSVMRDTFVPMEHEGKSYYGKINSAYSKGPEHAIKTLNENFDLDISEYATVNFFGMADIIDAVGGITATITEDELRWKGHDHPNLNNVMDDICSELKLNPNDYYIKSAGEQTLNGVQAVAYARVRHCTSVWGTRDDFGRTDRQRHVMHGLFNKAITMKKTDYVGLAKALIPCSETSLSYTDIIGLATNILLSSPTFEEYRLPPAEYQNEFLMSGPSGYGSIIYYDLEYVAKMVNAIIYEDVTIDQFVTENPIQRNSWYKGTSTHTQTTTPTQTPPTTEETSDESTGEETVDPNGSLVEEDPDETKDTNGEGEEVTGDTPTDGEETPTQDDEEGEDSAGGENGAEGEEGETIEDTPAENDPSGEGNTETETETDKAVQE